MTAEHERWIRLLGAAYPAHPLTADRLAAYLVGLADLDPDDLGVAIVDLIKSGGPFMPAAAEVRRVVLYCYWRPADPGECWAEVQRQASCGPSGHPDFTNASTYRAVEMIGGWYSLCKSETPAADRKAFTEAIERLNRHVEQHLLLAPGLTLGGRFAELDAEPPDQPFELEGGTL